MPRDEGIRGRVAKDKGWTRGWAPLEEIDKISLFVVYLKVDRRRAKHRENSKLQQADLKWILHLYEELNDCQKDKNCYFLLNRIF